ncbi:hypothetical protein ACRE_049470 [Hapsidospora chrysogenum ATCC 11550]|uniref:Endo-beta-1,2-glucanase SGL domain-containing protein n=1 Tax=Hapsidospora chrysogenum (strain ATCC 11550 / CBS 779.69 / DSM 880 / IAM 14645 / JCM 23072 / IMI 49137) TaxID=857340 RepID=A0A086T4K7_HAPC1|nr:hypothetical protein ACRE_049470 [Hapsidospora chrysogenum ATCC 11550]
MRLSRSATVAVLLGASSAAPGGGNTPGRELPSCRFAQDWSQKEILARPNDFIWDMLYWEGKFHRNNVAYNEVNGMSYDGTQIDWVTGEATKKHTFSAASKEASQPAPRNRSRRTIR